MPERKYSVAEIDRMRKAIARTYPPRIGSSMNGGPVTYSGEDYTATIEDRLRTYMLNGTDPEELEKLEPHFWWKAANREYSSDIEPLPTDFFPADK